MKRSLDYGQLQDIAKRILARDNIRLNNTNYTPYTGKTVSPMSSLTQKAQELEARRTQKGIPYTNTLNTLINKPTQGISPNDIQRLIEDLKEKHSSFNNSITKGKLTEQFKSSFNPYVDQYNNRFNKDTELRSNDSKVNLEELNDKIKDLANTRNNTAFNAITNSSVAKQNRENNLIGMQKEFGTQKHGVNNIELTADKARFEAEKREPYERLSNLQRALEGLNMEEDHPDLMANNARQLEKALKAYGVNTSLPVDRWAQSATPNLHTATYTGKLAEPINADMATSYELAESISPSYQDKNYDARKNIRRELVKGSNNIDKFVNSELQDKLAPRYHLINEEAKQKANADMTALNAKYIRQNMYGGQSHIKSASERMQELNNAAYGTKDKILNSEIISGLNTLHNEDINKISKLNQYDHLANSEFGNMLNDIKRTNTVGIDKWKNAQHNNEQLYKSYQNEKAHQQPKFFGNDGFSNDNKSNFNNQGIDWSQISDLRGRYNTLENELKSNITNNDINNYPTYTTSQNKLIAEQGVKQALAEQQRLDKAKNLAERQRDETKKLAEELRLSEQQRNKIDKRYNDYYFYDTEKMKQDIAAAPELNDRHGVSHHPAARFLRRNTNYYTKPDGSVSKYGAYNRRSVENYINNPDTYKELTYLKNYRFPEISRDIIEKDERNHPYG